MLFEQLYTLAVLVNIPIAAATLFFALFLLRRWRDPIIFNFGMSALMLAIWIANVTILFLDVALVETYRLALVKSRFIFGMLVMHFFLIFTYKYPYPLIKDRTIVVGLYIFNGAYTVFIAAMSWFPLDAYYEAPFHYIVHSDLSRSIFIIHFTALSLWAFSNLIYKLALSEGIFRRRLRKIIVGTGIAVAGNIILSIGSFFVTDLDLNPFGILFTVTVLAYIYSIVRLKDE